MSKAKHWVHVSLWVIGSVFGLVGLLYVSGWVVRPNLDRPPVVHDERALAEVERLRDTRIDPDNPLVLLQNVDYAQGEAASWFPRGESPILAQLVEEGELPPVHERVGPEPAVLKGVDGVGNYGGTWYRVCSSQGDLSVITWRLSGATMARWSPQGYPIVPHLVKGWDVEDDGRVYVVHLRRGARWSDGHPLTADDIMFWYEQEVLFYDQAPTLLRIGPDVGRIERVDDYTVRFVFPEPNGLFPERMAGAHTWCLPAHYLERYHPEIGDPEAIAAMQASLGVASPQGVYNRVKNFLNPEHPRLWPWVYRTYQANPPYAFVRNPYYPVVDEAGNQLPYIDRLLMDIKAPNMIGVTAAGGEITMQLRHIRYEDYTLLMNQRRQNNYEVFHWPQGTRSVYTVFPVLNRRIDPARPDTALKHELLNEVTFRQALSLAINRRAIIRAEYNNQIEPAQIDPGPDSPFHHPPLFHSFTEFDPDRANRKLDELGLTQRDRDGFRLFRDGTRMTFYLNVTDYTGSGPAQFIIDDWARIGVRVILRERARPLFYAEKNAYDHDFTVWMGESEIFPLVQPRNFVPTYIESFFAPAWGVWYGLGGFYGDPRAERPGSFGPPKDHPLYRAMEVLGKAQRTVDLDEQVEIFREVLQIAAENVWHISIGTPPPQLVVVDKNLRNVPDNALVGADYATPANAGIETYFFVDPSDSPGAIAQVRRAMTTVTPEPRSVAGREAASTSGVIGLIIRVLVLGTLGLLLLMAAFRHPYIGRRLLIMIPTLLIISIIVFVIIQLPPGDFISARIAELQMTGDEAALRQVEELKELFHLEETYFQRYLRWLGIYWFTGFQSSDRGLIQGDLGRSMEDGRRVNDVVGDRIALTVTISALTIIFTWAFAVPAGIYSAVRQYSISDYILTFVGFIGMCVPNFLLALVLIYASAELFGVQVTGLFSAEYAGQPEWTWGKVVDLLQHIWVPVLVLGIGGTAGMIRVMRGNLLDELRKPYVTTARAKGVRPLKLLLKYPVRLALNPFISGIGGIFPQLVSGGAIVAMVLSLPTVGPLMLSALLTQDMYLAGSMLMVLSLLGVFGTLVSDLLLLWLDPRIRMEGGTR
ncbi:MAG: ABC transporter permease subunit [Phycisphaeraceae bacterium]|nr:ABC transporter permease subunit [Phycisphaeraceae bacterium]